MMPMGIAALALLWISRSWIRLCRRQNGRGVVPCSVISIVDSVRKSDEVWALHALWIETSSSIDKSRTKEEENIGFAQNQYKKWPTPMGVYCPLILYFMSPSFTKDSVHIRTQDSRPRYKYRGITTFGVSHTHQRSINKNWLRDTPEANYTIY